MVDKQADLAGPGIGNYEDLEKILPANYSSLLSAKDTQKAIFATKAFIEDRLCRALNLMMVTVPLIVDAQTGVNDYLDRDGSRTPIQFHISNDHDQHPIEGQIVQAATKWKRMALRRFGMEPGEGLCTDMRAVRKDYFLDHDHSCYVDQWDWERAMHYYEHDLEYLKQTVSSIWEVLVEAEEFVQEMFPALKDSALSQSAEEDHLPAYRGRARHVPGPSAQGARNHAAARVPGGLPDRHRMDPEGRVSARDARRRL